MINPEKRVETYLLNCGLAINLMLEVKDHMMSQLNELWEEGQDFEEAFDIVKNEWHRELEPVKMWLLVLEECLEFRKECLQNSRRCSGNGRLHFLFRFWPCLQVRQNC